MASLHVSSQLLNAASPVTKSNFTGSPLPKSVGHKCSSANCRTCSSRSLRVFANNQEASDVTLASISASAPAPAPSQTLTNGLTIGAGLAVAAGIVLTAKALKSGKKEEVRVVATPSPVPIPVKLPGGYSRSVTRAADPAIETMATYFPNAMVDTAFVKATSTELFKLGFTKSNCIALVNTCRDEVCRPLATFIDEEFGLSFNLSGLGGLINSGKTGFKAGMSHSPEFPCDKSGKPRERYVFFAFPHVSVGETGEVGSLLRRGRGKPSSACGALIAIKNDAKVGSPPNEDPDDDEYQLLKKKVLSSHLCQNCGPAGPDLVTVTKAALEVITSDLERIVSQVVDPKTADYAVITGVQIHSGAQVAWEPFRVDRTIDYVAPGVSYAVIQGKKRELKLTAPSEAKVLSTA